MATDKRARQRANREQKKAAAAKQKRRKDAFALIKKWAIYGVVLVAAFIIISFLIR